MSFNSLALSDEIIRALIEQGYSQPTAIQAQAIPLVLAGHDLLGGAQTGTGKTAAFVLPLLELLKASSAERRSGPARVLILAPTRELAAQISESVRDYGKYLPFTCATIFGGVSINPQIDLLRRGVDIIVATPGRLLDHMRQRSVNLSKIDFLVLDEADRMLDMGFIRDIRKILAILPKKRQNLLFSATFSEAIKELAASFLTEPKMVQVAKQNTAAATVTQISHPVESKRKRELLSFLIKSKNWHQVLVFIRTKHGANRLSAQLVADGINSLAIHGNKSQGARTRALADFKDGSVRVLVATDIAARGIDIDQLPYVVNFDLPHVAEDYVHRIGRTGRASSTGTAVSLLADEETPLLRAIEKLIKTSIPRDLVPGFEPKIGRFVEEEPRRSHYRR